MDNTTLMRIYELICPNYNTDTSYKLPPDLLRLCLSYLLDRIDTRKSKGYTFDDMKIGLWTTITSSEQIIANYLQNKIHGLYSKYSLEGNIKNAVTYVHGTKFGLFEEWEMGRLIATGHYYAGCRHGLCMYWHRNGQIHREDIYFMGSRQCHLSYVWNYEGERIDSCRSKLCKGECSRQIERMEQLWYK